jgi:3-hydroxymyristoyl/3-hydroxydecanoyl-(acyl carrier protein) dehydratase
LSTRIEARLGVSADHPSLPGHFPGQPVVPGVLLLERLIEAAQESIGSPLRVTGMPQVKFLTPLLPGEEAIAVMELQEPSPSDISRALPGGEAALRATAAQPAISLRFRVERAGQAIAQGAFHVTIGQEPL